jgi:CRP-like cAMP-binding protein
MGNHAVLETERARPSLSADIRSALVLVGVTGRRSRLVRGSMLSLHEGHAGLHVLVSGRMKTMRFSKEGRVILLDILDAGDVFGEMSIFGGEEASPAYAEALEDAEIETIPRLAVERALGAAPALAIGLARLMGARRERLERRLEGYVFERVPARLVDLLLELAERFGEPRAGGTVLDIPLNQQDLANFIGASREIVSLTLSELKRREMITMEGRRIVIDGERLRRIEAPAGS